MKKFFLTLICLIGCLTSFAQNDLGKADDEARIALTPYLYPEFHFSKEVQKQLTNKMNAILTKTGLAGGNNQRFIITATADVLSEDIVVTTKEMYQYELNVNFIVGDGFEGIKYAMASQTVKGLGETKADAYIQAFKKIKVTDPVFAKMISDAKNKIIEYYNSHCDFIIAEAKALAGKQDFDGAIYKLVSVPDVCKECYEKCMAEATVIYQKKIDQEGAAFLAQARNVWSAGLNADAAAAASEILRNINPQSSSFSQAEDLASQIAKRMKELDQREWDFKLKQQNDAVALERASIKAMRDIGVAYGEHQQPVNYNLMVL